MTVGSGRFPGGGAVEFSPGTDLPSNAFGSVLPPSCSTWRLSINVGDQQFDYSLCSMAGPLYAAAQQWIEAHSCINGN